MTATSSAATGRCSTPRGTTSISPSRSSTVRSRNSMRNAPRTTRNSSSSCSWLCQTNSPRNFTSFTCWPLSSATIFGDQCAVNLLSFSDRLIFCISDGGGLGEDLRRRVGGGRRGIGRQMLDALRDGRVGGKHRLPVFALGRQFREDGAHAA